MNHRIERKTLRVNAGAPTCELTSGTCCGDPIGPTTPATVVTRRKLWLPPGSQLVGDPFCVDIPNGDCCDTPSADGASGIRLTKQRVLVPAWAVTGEACEVVDDCDLCPVPVECSPSPVTDYPRWITVTSFYWDNVLRSTTLVAQATVEYQDELAGLLLWSDLAKNSVYFGCSIGRGPRINFPIPVSATPFAAPYGQITQRLGQRYVITLVEPTPFSQYDPDYFNAMDEISGDTEAWAYTHPTFGSMTFVKSNNRFWYTGTFPKLAIYRYGADYLLLWGLSSSLSIASAINTEVVSGALSWGRKIGSDLVFDVVGSTINGLPAGVNTVTMTPTTGEGVTDVIGIGDRFVTVNFAAPHYSPHYLDLREPRATYYYAEFVGTTYRAIVPVRSDSDLSFGGNWVLEHGTPGFGTGSTMQLLVSSTAGFVGFLPTSYSVGTNHVWTYDVILDGVSASIEVRT